MRRTVLLLALVFVAATQLWGQRIAKYGEKAPALPQLQFILDNRASYDGKALYIEFFKSDSPHSIELLEDLERFAKRYKGRINFLLIDCEDGAKLKEIYQGKDIHFSIATDAEHKAFKQYNVEYIPTSVLIDRKGNFIWQGRSSEVSDLTLLNAIE